MPAKDDRKKKIDTMKLRIFCVVLLLSLFCYCHGDEQFAKSIANMLTKIAEENADFGESIAFDTQFDASITETDKLEDNQFQNTRNTNPTVSTTSGEVEGVTTSEVHAFYEIPYAQPPTGELRFQPPLPITTPQPIDGTTSLGIRCHQYESLNCIVAPITCGRRMSEDCLLLNVFVPNYVNLTNSDQPPDDTLPVILYIHGGSFNRGSKGSAGGELASVTNTVVVTINYRLGPLGFIVQRETGYQDIEGNQGIKDQQLAMKWVQDNIDNFGGDKEKVTLLGGSAGSQSVMFHSVSVVSKPLYLRAIQQSNPAVIGYQTPDESLQITNYLSATLCNRSLSQRECLMDAEPIELVNRQIPMNAAGVLMRDLGALAEPYRPVIDGDEFTDQPLTLYRSGNWNSDKNMIIGVNTEELDDIPYYIPEVVPTGDVLFTIANYYIFGVGLTDTVVKKYQEAFPPGEDGDYAPTFGKEMSHLFFICPSRAMARFAAKTATNDAKIYFYANEHPVLDGLCRNRNNGSDTGCYLASHGDEMRFVFRTTSNPTEDDQAVENQFSTYWGSFARTGEPSNGLEVSLGEYPSWPQYSSEVQGEELWESIRIKASVGHVETGYEEDICDFWDTTGYYMEPILPTTIPTTSSEGGPTNTPVIVTTSGSKKTSQGFLLVMFNAIVLTKYLRV